MNLIKDRGRVATLYLAGTPANLKRSIPERDRRTIMESLR